MMMHYTTGSTRLIAAAMALSIAAATADAQQQAALFTDATPEIRLPVLDPPLAPQGTSGSMRVVGINPDVFQPGVDVLRLNLLDGVDYTALVTWEPTESGHVVSGVVFGVDMSFVTLAVTDDELTESVRVVGTVRVPPNAYRIRPHPGGLHEIVLIDPGRRPPLAEPLPTCGVGAERRVCDDDEVPR